MAEADGMEGAGGAFGATGRQLLTCAAASYGSYATFVLVEVLDFLALLHSPPPGDHATYDIVVVAFFMVEMVVCACLGLLFALLRLHGQAGRLVVAACLALSEARWGLAAFLYIGDGEGHRIVPYIYKVANPSSDAMRVICVPGQVLLGFAAAWWCRQGASRPDVRPGDAPA